MKKMIVPAACAALLAWSGSADAITYTDTLYGDQYDMQFVSLGYGWGQMPSVQLDFDVTGPGGYNPETQQITSGSLSITFGDNDGWYWGANETVMVFAGITDGNTLLAYQTYDLGRQPEYFWQPYPAGWEYATMHLDLAGLLPYLQDGTFSSLVFSVWEGDWDSDIYLKTATFTVEAMPVPEPATLALFGAGLIGLTGIARRKKVF